MKHVRWLVTGGASIAMVAATAVPASAATYDGVDPNTSPCNNTATTVASVTVQSADDFRTGTIELRYSTACRTVWVRATGPLPNEDGPGIVGTVVRNSDGKSYGTSSTTRRSGSTRWSLMLNDVGVTSYAKGFIDTGNPGPTKRTSNY